MPAPPRLLLPKTLVFITTRIEEGLPLIPAAFMRCILEGILARAQALFPVRMVAHKFMFNHLHLLMVVANPDDIVAFMDRVKTESAHAINRLLGRRRRTVWQAGYDSPTVLTIADAVAKLAYLYTNAQRAGLEDTIEAYPGLSSWQMFKSGVTQKVCKWIRRTMITKLAKRRLSVSEQEELAAKLSKLATEEHTLRLEPDAWLNCFGVTNPEEIQRYREEVIKAVRDEEARLRQERQEAGKRVVGKARLLAQPIDTPFTPKSFGRRMWCICEDGKLRKEFIQFVKGLIAEGRAVLALWRMGDATAQYPPGLFPPSMPKGANLITPEFA